MAQTVPSYSGTFPLLIRPETEGAPLFTIAKCRKRARERTALAEREPRHKSRHLNAAEAWRLLADRMEQAQRRNKLHPDATLTDTAEDILTRYKSEGTKREIYNGHQYCVGGTDGRR
jgi:hypothetical protein